MAEPTLAEPAACCDQRAAAAYRRAARVLRCRLEQDGAGAEVALALVEALLRAANRTEDARARVALLVDACDVDPYDWRVRAALGAARVCAGDTEGGLGDLRVAATFGRRNAEPHVILGFAVLRRRDPLGKDAEGAFIEAIALSPSHGGAHAGRVVAACVSPKKKGELSRAFTSGLRALTRLAEHVPLVAWLALSVGLSLAWRTPGKKLQAEPEPFGAVRALLGELEPWLRAFPEDGRLRMARGALLILGAPASALAEIIAARAPDFSDHRLLYLFVRRRVAALPPVERAAALEGALKRPSCASGLHRAFLLALNEGAREAVREGRIDDAEALWRRGLAADALNVDLRHNLALVALARGDGPRFAARMRGAMSLLLGEWLLVRSHAELLQRIADGHQAVAARLHRRLQKAMATPAAPLDPDAVAAWVGEMVAAVVVRAFLFAYREGAAPPADLSLQLFAYLRAQAPLARAPREVPPALRGLVDRPLSRSAPVHHLVLDLPLDAPASAVEKRCLERREMIERAIAAAEPEAAEALRSRLRAVEEARAVLTDESRRRAYEAGCVPPDEHRVHLLTCAWVCDLHDLLVDLANREQMAAAEVLVRAYQGLPTVHLSPYLDARFPGLPEAIAEHVRAVDVGVALRSAVTDMEAERFAEAEERLTGVAQRHPEDAMVLFHLAQCQASAGRLDEALRALARARPGARAKGLLEAIQRLEEELRKAVERKAEREAARLAAACLEREDYAGALRAIAAIPAGTERMPDTRLLEHVARARRLAADPAAARVAGDTLPELSAAIERLVEETDHEEIKRQASALLRQLRAAR